MENRGNFEAVAQPFKARQEKNEVQKTEAAFDRFFRKIEAADPHDLEAVEQCINSEEKGVVRDAAVFLWHLRNIAPSSFTPEETEMRCERLLRDPESSVTEIEKVLHSIESGSLAQELPFIRLTQLAKIDIRSVVNDPELYRRLVVATQKEAQTVMKEARHTGEGYVADFTIMNIGGKDYSFQTIDLWRYMYRQGLSDWRIFLSEGDCRELQNVLSKEIFSVIENRVKEDFYKKDEIIKPYVSGLDVYDEESKKNLVDAFGESHFAFSGTQEVLNGVPVGYKFQPTSSQASQTLATQKGLFTGPQFKFGWHDMPEDDHRLSFTIPAQGKREVLQDLLGDVVNVISELSLEGMPVTCKITDDENFNPKFRRFLVYVDFFTAKEILTRLHNLGGDYNEPAEFKSDKNGKNYLFPFGNSLVSLRSTGEANYDEGVVTKQLEKLKRILTVH